MLRPRAESNRQRGVTKYIRIKRTHSPVPSEDAPTRTLRGRVAVSTLTSGQQPEV